MNTVFIEKLRIRNFKGIEDLEVPFHKITEISGKNREGKTTIYDAVRWIFSGKNSANESEFGIKNTKKPHLNRLDHEVEAFCLVNNERTIFKKVYKEVWTAPKGEAVEKLTGHTTEYFINHASKKKAEYEAYMDSIARKDIIRLVTDVMYYNSLSEEERRKLLLDACGEISDNEIVGNARPDIMAMLERKGTKTIQEYESMVNAKISKLDEQKKTFAPRIDEASRAINNEINFDLIRIELSGDKLKKDDISSRINDIVKHNEEINQSVLQKQREKANAKLKAEELYSNDVANATASKRAVENSIAELKVEKSSKERQYNSIKSEISLLSSEIDKAKEERNRLLEEYKSIVNEVAPEFDSSTCVCQSCGSAFSPERINEIKANHYNEFEKTKQERIQGNIKKGTAKKESISSDEALLAEKTEASGILEDAIKEIDSKINELSKQLLGIDTNVVLSQQTIEAKKLYESIEIPEVKTHDTGLLKEELMQVEAAIEKNSKLLSIEETNKKQAERVSELKKEEENVIEELMHNKGEKQLILDYKKLQSSVIESRVNDMFSLTKFKMFHTQMNGEIVPCCITTYDGVEYSDLNNADKINCGLDIINFLSKTNNVSFPIFIDNSESVNEIIPSVSQMILLSVTKLPLSINHIKM